jgi:N-acetylneuraminic acid mutarotase
MVMRSLSCDGGSSLAFRSRVPVNGSVVPTMREGYSYARIGSKVYCFGGSGSSKCLDDMYCFDVLEARWSKCVPTSKRAAQPSARAEHAFLCYGSKIIVHGGMNPAVGDWSCWLESNGITLLVMAHCTGVGLQQSAKSPLLLGDMFQFDVIAAAWSKLLFDTDAPNPGLRRCVCASYANTLPLIL